jgi:hypothetical protein
MIAPSLEDVSRPSTFAESLKAFRPHEPVEETQSLHSFQACGFSDRRVGHRGARRQLENELLQILGTQTE